MNKYQDLFDEILSMTKKKTLKWKQVRKLSNSAIIFNPGLVFRQFETTLPRPKQDYAVLLVEKKYDDPEHDFECQRYEIELIVVEDGELVLNLTDSVIERSELIRLVQMVEVASDKASSLFRGK